MKGATKNFWLVKQEPETYSWEKFCEEKGTEWTGVRNFQARNFLRAMKKGDEVFYYHSGDEKQIVGKAQVEKEARPDSSAEPGEDWVMVYLRPVKKLSQPITLQAIKADPKLQEMKFVRQSRLSVSPVTAKEASRIELLTRK